MRSRSSLFNWVELRKSKPELHDGTDGDGVAIVLSAVLQFEPIPRSHIVLFSLRRTEKSDSKLCWGLRPVHGIIAVRAGAAILLAATFQILAKRVPHAGERASVEAVMRPPPVFAGDDDALAAKLRHVMRERGLPDSEVGEQLACAKLIVLHEELNHMQARGVGKRLEAAGYSMTRELRASFEMICSNALPQVERALDDCVDGGDERSVSLARGVFESPVFAVPCRERRTCHAAAHGDEYVDARQRVERFWALCRGVDAVTVV